MLFADSPDDPNLAQLFDSNRTGLMTAILDLPGGRRGRLAEKVLVEIDNVSKVMSTVANALTNATTVVTGKCASQGSHCRLCSTLDDPRRSV